MVHNEEIRARLSTYQRALNDSDDTVAAACEASDVVCMPTMMPSIVGAAMREGYARIFRGIKVSVRFAIDKPAQVSPAAAKWSWS